MSNKIKCPNCKKESFTFFKKEPIICNIERLFLSCNNCKKELEIKIDSKLNTNFEDKTIDVLHMKFKIHTS